MTQRAAVAASATGAALVAALVLLPHLGGHPLWDPDEGRHAEIARELFVGERWQDRVLPRSNFEPYRDKPILFYWLTAGAYALGGVGEAMARLVPALSALATVVAVAAWGAAQWGPRAGFLAGAVLVTAVEFAALGRFVNLDMALTLWITLGILAVHRFGERGGVGASLVPAAIAGALGMLTKGLVAPTLIAIVGTIHLVAQDRIRLLTPRVLGRATLAFLAIAVPWHALVWWLDPQYFHDLFFLHQWRRFTGGRNVRHAKSALFYVPILLGGFFPWSLLLPATLASTLARARRGAPELLCAAWAGTVFAFFAMAEGKLGTYVLPAFPPLALLTARHLDRLLAGDRTYEGLTRAGLWGVAATLLVVPVVVTVLARAAYDGVLFPTSLLALPAIPAAIGIGMLLRRDRLAGALLASGATVLVGLVVFYRAAAPAIATVVSAAPLAASVLANAPGHTAAPLVAYQVRSPSLAFYLRRPVLHLARPKQLARVVAEHPLVLVVTSPQHLPTIQATATLHPWYVGSRRVLYATVPPPSALTPATPDG